MGLGSRYRAEIKRNCTHSEDSKRDLIFWRNKLFATTLIYLLPLSLIALLPELYWTYKTGIYSIGIIDILAVITMFLLAFLRGIDLAVRKIIFIACIYIFSVAIIYYLDVNGPGMLYLLAACIFSLLIFPSTKMFWPAWLNTLICISFWFLIWLKLLPGNSGISSLSGQWIAVSSNLIFLSFLSVALIPRLFKKLQDSMDLEGKWLDELHKDRETLQETSKSLNQSLRDFNKIMDSSMDVICTVDDTGRFLRVSAACESIWGYKPEELIGKPTIDFVYPEDRESTRRVAEKVKNGINVNGFENRYIHKNGSLVSISWAVRWDPIDRVRYGIARNVTDQVLSRKKLEDSELRLNESQALAHVGSWEIDIVLKTCIWSDEMYKIFGVMRNEVDPTSETFLFFVHPDDFNFVKRKLKDSLKYNRNFSFNFRFIRKDGTTRHGYTEAFFEFDKNNDPVRLFGIIMDTTKRKETEKQLRNSEAFIRGVLNSLNSNIAVIDFKGNIVAVNDSWKNFGIENGALSEESVGVGRNYFEVCSDAKGAGFKLAEEACRGIKETMDGKAGVFYLEYPCNSPVSKRWFGMRAMKFEGNQPMVVISHQEISERKIAESERNIAAVDLIQRNHDLEQFTYIVSHNLRAPVANILGLAAMWDDPTLIQQDKDEISSGLRESVFRLDDVIKDLNKILELKSGINEPKEMVRFSDLVEDIKISIKNLIDDNQVEIIYDFTKIDHFSTTKGYLYSIFYNLIRNSIEYRQKSIPCIIAVKSRINKNRVELIFSDNGMGIDLKLQGNKVFGLYKRFHPGTEGKGMGLFMVKSQVEMLGGKISIQSEVNKGTEFKIEFEL